MGGQVHLLKLERMSQGVGNEVCLVLRSPIGWIQGALELLEELRGRKNFIECDTEKKELGKPRLQLLKKNLPGPSVSQISTFRELFEKWGKKGGHHSHLSINKLLGKILYGHGGGKKGLPERPFHPPAALRRER